MSTGSSEPQFNQVQPCVVTKAPDANEVKAIVVNTQKFIAACALSFSCDVYACIASVVLPVNKKFQPTPNKNKASKN